MINKIILADNQSVFRTGAARIFAVEDDFRIIGQCDDLPRLIKAVSVSQNCTVIFASSLKPSLPELILSAKQSANRAIAILENDEVPQDYLNQGLNGIVYRDIQNTELLRCVRNVGKGETFVQRRSTEALSGFEVDVIAERVRERLTPKELIIVGLILQGYKNRDIAEELNNSEQVIKNYLRSIFDKTGVSDRLELALFVMHHKVLADAARNAHTRKVEQPPPSFQVQPAY